MITLVDIEELSAPTGPAPFVCPLKHLGVDKGIMYGDYTRTIETWLREGTVGGRWRAKAKKPR